MTSLQSTWPRTTTRAFASLAFVVLAGALGCRAEKTPGADSTKPADSTRPAAAVTDSNASGARRVGVIQGFKTPESVHYDAASDAYFVSNIDGNPSAHDGKGSIVRIPADTTDTVRVFAEGGKNGVELNAPKGIATAADMLFVADIDVVRVFSRRTGAPIRTIDLKPLKATFLNDITV